MLKGVAAIDVGFGGGIAFSWTGIGAAVGGGVAVSGVVAAAVEGTMAYRGADNLAKDQQILAQVDNNSSATIPSYGKKSVPNGPYREVNGYPVKVKHGDQEKHIVGTPNFNQEVANGKSKSIFYGNNAKAQELLEQMGLSIMAKMEPILFRRNQRDNRGDSTWGMIR